MPQTPTTPDIATPPAFRAAAEAALAEANFASARRFAEQAAEGFRSAGDRRRVAYIQALRGDIARAEGNLDEARGSYRSALEIFGLLEDGNLIVRMITALGDLFMQAGDAVAAAEEYGRAVDRSPTDTGARTGLGYAQLALGTPADAEATFTQTITAAPQSPKAHTGRALARVEMRDHDRALDDIHRALEAGPSPAYEADIRATRAYLLAALRRAPEGEVDAELAAARALDPERALTHLRAAQVMALRNRATEAREEAIRALSAQPPLAPHSESVARRLAE